MGGNPPSPPESSFLGGQQACEPVKWLLSGGVRALWESEDPLWQIRNFKLNCNADLNGKKESWFSQILLLCKQYGLPPPLRLLQKPVEKTKFHSLVKLNIADDWQTHFRKRSDDLSSLRFFQPEFMSLLIQS